MQNPEWIDQLADSGLVLWDGFLGEALARQVRAEVLALFEAGLGRPARVGRNSGEALAPAVRNDEIFWLDATQALPAGIQQFFDRIEDLREQLNREAFLGLRGFECHAARYQPGAFYKVHRDAFAEGSNRVVSCVYFLNPDWVSQDAGELHVLTPGSRRIEPLLDRLVLFRSADILHEVLPTNADRYTLTGWMYGVDEGRREQGGILADLD
ncbi:2OG-Fe(II) oxygenase [Thermithiobacillus plumbiphilus]|uniref:2OG-Fe(II) oxygenase n=1 Tax=Thermithiobacillus plumbiphilus TaxID=1729899 RepID=A0ABU9D695_9PROT